MCFSFKVAISFPVNKFPKTVVLRNKHTYIIISGSYEGFCLEFEQKTTTTLLSNCPQVLKIVYD